MQNKKVGRLTGLGLLGAIVGLLGGIFGLIGGLYLYGIVLFPPL